MTKEDTTEKTAPESKDVPETKGAPESNESKAPEAIKASSDAKKTDASKSTSKPAGNRGGNSYGGGRGQGGRGGQGGGRGRSRGGRRGKGRGRDKGQDEFESKIIDLARVTRVMAGGKRMSFRCCVLIGDGKGRIAMGVKKGSDVQLAVQKASDYAKKNLITVPVVEGTIPHTVETKFKGARIMLKPAKAGTGIIAGGPVRIAMEMAGIKNVVAKIKGSNNKINNLTAVLNALDMLRTEEEIAKIKS